MRPGLRPGAPDRALVLLVAALCACITLAAAGASFWLRTSADELARQVFAAAGHRGTQLQVTHADPRADRVPGGAGRQLTGVLGPTLQDVLGAPRHAALTLPMVPQVLPDRPGVPMYLTVAGFPDVEQLVEVVAGRMPRPGNHRRALPPAAAADHDGGRRPHVVEVALEASAARAMGIPVGGWVALSDTSFNVGRARPAVLHVVGTVRATDPFPTALDDVPSTRSPSISVMPENNVVRATAIAADVTTVLASPWEQPADLQWSFDLVRSPSAAQSAALVPEARRAELQSWPAVADPVSTRAVTGIGEVGDTAVRQRASSDGMVALVLSGLAGAALAVLLTAAVVLAGRRAAVAAVVRARGASTAWLVGRRGAEALLLVAPGMVVVATGWLVWPDVSGPDLLAGAVAAAVCALLVTGAQTVPRTGGTLGTVLRDACQIALVGLAAAATVRAVVTPDLRPGDPVLLAVPVLLAAAGAVLAVRSLGWGLGLLRRVLGRGPALTPVVALGQAVDVARRAVLATTALVLAASTALLAVTVVDTIRVGAQQAATEQVGADVVVSAGALDDGAVRRLSAVPGTRAATPVVVLDQVTLALPAGLEKVRVVGMDVAELARVGSRWTDGLQLPRPGGEQLRVVASPGLDLGASPELTYGHASAPLQVVDRVPWIPRISNEEAFLLVDLGALRRATGRDLDTYASVLLAGSPDLSALEDVVHRTDPDGQVLGHQQVRQQRLDRPVVERTRRLVLTGLAAAAVLGGFALLLVVGLGGPVRRHTAAVLAVAGADPPRARRAGMLGVLPTVAAGLLAAVASTAIVTVVVDRGFDPARLTGTAADLPVLPSATTAVGCVAVVLVLLGLAALAARPRASTAPSRHRPQPERP